VSRVLEFSIMDLPFTRALYLSGGERLGKNPHAAVVNIVFLVFIIVVYSVGCCAFRNSRRDNYAYRRGGGWNQGGYA
jgi:hypothetical protein